MADANLALKCCLVAAVATTAGCGGASSSPTAPGNPAVAFQAGTWVGGLEQVSCTGSSLSRCSNRPINFALRMIGDGRAVLQIADTDVYYNNRQAMAVEMTAGRQPDGSLVMTGNATYPDWGEPTRLEARLELSSVSAGNLAGTVRYTVTEDYVTTKEARIIYSTSFASATPGAHHGQWVGYGTRTSCSGDCTAWDPLMQYFGVDLRIAQSGGALTGRLNYFVVTGSATGNAMTLSGRSEADPANCRPVYDGMTCLMEVTNFVATVDALERLQGSFDYRVQGYQGNGRPFDIRARITLTGVVRWPW